MELILDTDPGAVKKMFVGDFVDSIHSSVLNRLADTPYQSSILFVINVDDVNEYVSLIKNTLRTSNKGFYFYLVLEQQGNLHWFNVIQLKNVFYPAVNEIINWNQNQVFLEDHNLQGMPIKSLSLSWKPFFTLSRCLNGGIVI